MSELGRVIRYSLGFYLSRLNIILLFSVPFLLAFLIFAMVSAPTYPALGGLFNRTGSIPELSIVDILVIAVAYTISFFIIADTITNVNLIVRSSRTRTMNPREVLAAMQVFATRIFYIFTIMLLLVYVAQLVLFENSFRNILFPLFTLIMSFLLFFVAPAIVIDGEDVAGAIVKSANMALRKPVFIFAWAMIGLVSLSVVKVLFDFVLPHSYSPFAVLFVNSLFVLPFLIVLQTQMYMEKYPLAR